MFDNRHEAMFYTFQQKTELEQLRALESLPNSAVLAPSPKSVQSYDAWLLKRLSAFKSVPSQADVLHKPMALFKRFMLGFVVVFFLVGLISGGGLIATEQQQVNVFWLFGSLVGANAVALILWLVFVVVLRGHNPGLIAGVLEWPLSRLYRAQLKPTSQQVVNLAWWHVQFSPLLQTWRLGGLTHLAWFCFLCGSYVGLILLFTTQQYDFIWESTLISQPRFQVWIQTLGAPLDFLSLPIAPINDMTLSDETRRRQWALFILSCVMLYAIVPRAMALLLTYFTLRYKQRTWPLDFSRDYYIRLRGQFNAELHRSRVVDADTVPLSDSSCALSFSAKKIPADLDWYGLEVNPSRPWGALFPRLQSLLNDSQKVADLQMQLQRSASDIVIFVEGQRLPDRGLIRSLKGFNKDCLWLAITTDTELSQIQQGAWLKAIMQCQLNEQHCVLVKTV